LRHHYLYGLEVDSGDPQSVIISASMGPGSAYSIEDAESFVYKRDEHDKKWKAISNDLPESKGTTISVLASNPKVSGEFYAVNYCGVFCSVDSSVSWKRLDIQWPKYLSQTPLALQ
jgi:hypothetical protein